MSQFRVNDLVVPKTEVFGYASGLDWLIPNQVYRVVNVDDVLGIHLETIDGVDVPLHNFWNPFFFDLYSTFFLDDSGI